MIEKEDFILDKVRPYSIPVKSFEKIADEYEEAIYFKKEEFEQNIKNFEEFIKDVQKNGEINEGLQGTIDDFEKYKSGFELLVLQDEEGKLYGIYMKGIPLEKFTTIGGYKFSEVAAKHVDIYSSLRNKIGYREDYDI